MKDTKYIKYQVDVWDKFVAEQSGSLRYLDEHDEPYWIEEYDTLNEAKEAMVRLINEADPAKIHTEKFGIGYVSYTFVEIYKVYYDEFDCIIDADIAKNCQKDNLTKEIEKALQMAICFYHDFLDYNDEYFYTIKDCYEILRSK